MYKKDDYKTCVNYVGDAIRECLNVPCCQPRPMCGLGRNMSLRGHFQPTLGLEPDKTLPCLVEPSARQGRFFHSLWHYQERGSSSDDPAGKLQCTPPQQISGETELHTLAEKWEMKEEQRGLSSRVLVGREGSSTYTTV